VELLLLLLLVLPVPLLIPLLPPMNWARVAVPSIKAVVWELVRQ
jgi:hypothetical protein